MRTLRYWITPNPTGDNSALMRRIKHQHGADLVGDLANPGHRVWQQIQATAQRDQGRFYLSRQFLQAVNTHSKTGSIYRCMMDVQTKQTSAAIHVMSHMPANTCRGNNDRVTRLATSHKRIKVCHGAGGNPDFSIAGIKHFRTQLCRDHFYLLCRFKSGFILVPRVPKRWAGRQTRRQQRLCPGVHYIGSRVQVKALLLVNKFVALCQLLDLIG